MEKKRILIIGRDPKTLQGVIDMLNNHNYEAYGEYIDEKAIETFKRMHFDAVAMGGGVNQQSRNLFNTEFLKINPDLKVIYAHPWEVLEELRLAFLDHSVNY